VVYALKLGSKAVNICRLFGSLQLIAESLQLIAESLQLVRESLQLFAKSLRPNSDGLERTNRQVDQDQR